MTDPRLRSLGGEAEAYARQNFPDVAVAPVVWVSRSFREYRIPVFRELDRLLGGELHLYFSSEYVGETLSRKASEVLGERAVGLSGEWKLGSEDRRFLANRNLSLRLQPGLRRAIGARQPRVVIGEGFFKWTFQALRYCARTRTPLVVNYERTAHTERNAQWYRTLYRRWALGRVAAVNCSGRLCREYVESLGFEPRRIRTGHMVADTETLAARARALPATKIAELRERFADGGPLFLCVGGLVERKGVEQLLAAWAAFERRGRPRASLVIVGSGAMEAKLAELARELGVAALRFAGEVSYEEMASFYAAADALVVSTTEDNWSLVVPEAMACGLPIVCSIYNGGWPELVREGENGWLVDPHDEAGFASVLAAAAGAADELRGMGRRSREIIDSGHTPRHAARSILETCRLAVASTDAGRRKLAPS